MRLLLKCCAVNTLASIALCAICFILFFKHKIHALSPTPYFIKHGNKTNSSHNLIASIAHSARADKTTPGTLHDTLAKMPPEDILFSYGNRDYLPFHLHWLCNTAAWEGVHARTLLVVDDEYSRAAIRRLSPNAHVHILPSMHHHKGFYSKGYRKLTIQRVEILVDLLRSGRGVVMFEGDAVWARNILTDPNLTDTRRCRRLDDWGRHDGHERRTRARVAHVGTCARSTEHRHATVRTPTRLDCHFQDHCQARTGHLAGGCHPKHAQKR